MKASNVFGLRNTNLPESYVERQIERDFKRALDEDRYSIITIYGSSKQGKTSLFRHALGDRKTLVASCSTSQKPESIYRDLVDQVGPMATTERSNVERTTNEIGIGIKLWALLRLKRQEAIEAQVKTVHRPVDIDFGNANMVARHLARSNARIVVVDNFHYLDDDVQRRMATDMKLIGEHGIKFIVLGTWRSDKYLQRFNADLNQRTKEIPVEPWSEQDLQEVILKGAKILNITFSSELIRTLLSQSEGNVGLLQTFLAEYLHKMEVSETCSKTTKLENLARLNSVVSQVKNDLRADVIKNFQAVADVGDAWIDGKTRTNYILRGFLMAETRQLVEGIALKDLYANVLSIVPHKRRSELPENTFSNLAKNTIFDAQVKKLETAIVGYDHNIGRFVVFDSWARFVLRLDRQSVAKALAA